MAPAVISSLKIRMCHFHICCISILAPKEDVQREKPKFGRAIFTSVLLAFWLPKRVCRWWSRSKNGPLPFLFYQHSASQIGSAVSGAKIRTWHFHFCFISILAPREALQWVAPKLERWIFTFVFCFISILDPKEALQWVAPKLERCIFISVLLTFCFPKRLCNERRQN